MRVFFFIGTVNVLLSTIAYTYMRVHFPFAKSWTFTTIFILLMINMVGCRLLPLATPLFLVKISAWLSGLWIAVMYYILLLSIAHGFLHILDRLLKLNTPHNKIAIAAMTFIMLFVAWGTFRAFNPTTRTETIATSKLAPNSHYKIVLLSDIHLGQVLGRSYAEQLVTRVNALKPDLILIAGDILDEKIAYVERENSLEPLKNLQAKYGTYMAYGNHDYLDRPLVWQDMLEANNIHPLRNQYIIINNQLKITGINDWSRNRSNNEIISLNTDNNKFYSIIMDHQPRRMEAAADNKYDLYLAGHTHTGQLFPNRLITKKIYKLDYGRTEFQQMTAITSNGYGFWGPPVRTEVAPEIIVIELQAK